MSDELTPTQQRVLDRLTERDGFVNFDAVCDQGVHGEIGPTEAVTALRALKRKKLAKNRPSERVPGNYEWAAT